MNNIKIFDQLVLYRNITKDEIFNKAMLLLISEYNNDLGTFLRNDYYELQAMLLETMKNEPFNGTYWQGYLTKLIAESENIYSLSSEKRLCDENMQKIAEKDLEILKKIYTYDWSEVARYFNDLDTCVLYMESPNQNEQREALHRILIGKNNPEDALALSRYYYENGCGIFEKYCAFRWNDEGVEGIQHYDRISFESLIGYETQKKQLIENTDFFIQGMKANNVLLYGDKGTGKSSSIKALLNLYKDKKLKMIEVTKEQFYRFPDIIKVVENRGYRFIIFIDDLSFEEFETEYKHFKAILEGGLQARPQNIVIYVTSNRRNLVKETWKDQEEASGDMHISDSVQEKVSLVDRFGITITYPSPDKDLFLKMVMDLAEKEKINISNIPLCEEALKWEMRYHGRSGRSARQFIDYMISKTNYYASE